MPNDTTRLVILESPYAGDVEANVAYARACLRDSLLRGEAPIASHLLYTQPGVLNDLIPQERQQGIDAALAWRSVAHATVVYIDRGITKGMQYGIDAANADGIPVEMRRLANNPETTDTAIENAVARAIALHQVRSVKIVGEVDWVPWLPIARVAIAAYKDAANGDEKEPQRKGAIVNAPTSPLRSSAPGL